MLILSPRLTASDMRMWQESEQWDKLHASTLDKKIARSIKTIREFAKQKSYAGVSWGKDSVVLAHLIYRSGFEVPLVWIRVEPIKNPDCELVRDAFLADYPMRYEEIEQWCSKDHDGWHAGGTLERGRTESEHRFGRRRILGIRADESGERRLTCLVNGEQSEYSCRPLAWWSAQDVMGYLADNDLPVHPAYAMTGGGRYDRYRLRVASLGGRRGDGMGRSEWEREYYGDILNRLESGN